MSKFGNCAGNVGQRLRALVDFRKNRVQFPASKWWLIIIYNSKSKGSSCPLLASVGTVLMYYTYVHADKT